MMNRRSLRAFLCVGLMLMLLASTVGSAAAVPNSQAGMVPFEKLEWGMTLQYPSSWSIEADAEDALAIGFLQELLQDVAVFIMVRDPLYTANETMEDILSDGLTKLDIGLLNAFVRDGSPRTIAGVEARGATFTGTDPSTGWPLSGEAYNFVKGDYGYIVATAGSYLYAMHAVEFSGVLDSIAFAGDVPPEPVASPTRRVGRATPAPTEEPISTPTEEVAPTEEPTPAPTEEIVPTARPTRRTRPTVAPTEEAIPTEEPLPTQEPTAAPTGAVIPTGEPTPESGSGLARSSFDTVLPLAMEWDDAAELVLASCPAADLEAESAGRCSRWEFTFTSAAKGGFRWVVVDGAVDAGESGVFVTTGSPIEGEWADSVQAMQAWLDHGGREFVDRHLGVVAGMRLAIEAADSPAVWTVTGDAGAPPAKTTWTVTVGAATPEVDTTATESGSADADFVTAQEALESAALKAMIAKGDVVPVRIAALTYSNEAGHASGGANLWSVYFQSPSTGDQYIVYVSKGEAEDPEESSFPDMIELKAGWSDSPELMEQFRERPDFQAFAERFPAYDWLLEIEGSEGAKPNVHLTLEVKNVSVSMPLEPGEEAAATPEPTVASTPAPTAGPLPTATPGEVKTFSKEGWVVTFQYPAAWGELEVDPAWIAIAENLDLLQEGQIQGVALAVKTVDQSELAELSLREILARELAATLDLETPPPAGEGKPVTIGGLKGQELQSPGKIGDTEVTGLGRAALSGDKVYVFVVVAPTADVNSYEPVVDRLLASIEFAP